MNRGAVERVLLNAGVKAWDTVADAIMALAEGERREVETPEDCDDCPFEGLCDHAPDDNMPTDAECELAWSRLRAYLGQPSPAEKAAVVYTCRWCGKPSNPDYTYCQHCGGHLPTGPSTLPAETVPAAMRPAPQPQPKGVPVYRRHGCIGDYLSDSRAIDDNSQPIGYLLPPEGGK
jgi:hypothetical protein